MGGQLTMYEYLDKMDGPNFKPNIFFPSPNNSDKYTLCSVKVKFE